MKKITTGIDEVISLYSSSSKMEYSSDYRKTTVFLSAIPADTNYSPVFRYF